MKKLKQTSRPPRKRSARNNKDDRTDRFGTYVYCILKSDGQDILERAPQGLERRQKLEVVSAAGLSAVVSAVPLPQYGQGALEANLADAGWAATRVMHHEQVVEHFASRL